MSTLKVNTIQDTSGGGTTLLSAQNTAKAWVRFNGTGTAVINDSFNVSSLLDRGTGRYTISLTNPMASTNYAICSGAHIGGVDNNNRTADCAAVTTSEFYVSTYACNSGDFADIQQVHAVVFGD